MIITQAPSPNFGPRKNGARISMLVLHYTDTPTAFDALKLMQDPAHQASAHYLVDTDGAITQLVSEDMRAWHAGQSCWEGETDINSISIGIEIQNPGHSHGYAPFPFTQIQAVTKLCLDIVARHHILPQYVLGHSDVAPARKKDPGVLFPWQILATHGIGMWPDVMEEDELNVENIISDNDQIKSLLTRFGYDQRLDLKTILSAFSAHYAPEDFEEIDKTGKFTINTLQKISDIYRQKLQNRRKII